MTVPTGPSNAAEPRSDELVIRRVFDAPRALVFQAFAEADRLARWWGPKGFEIGVSKLDFAPGGVFHFSMTSPDGHIMWGRMVYREIAPPERIVWVNSFADETGNLAPVPFGDTWPAEMLNTVTLDEQGGRTVLTLRVSALTTAGIERETFVANFDSMREGYGGTWDQLAEYLAGERANA